MSMTISQVRGLTGDYVNIKAEITVPIQHSNRPELIRAALFNAITEQLNRYFGDTGLATVKQEGTMALVSRSVNATEHYAGEAQFFTIWNPQSNLPSQQTFSTEEEAWKVADQMCAKHDGQRFFVLKSVGSACVEKPVTRRTYSTPTKTAPKVGRK